MEQDTFRDEWTARPFSPTQPLFEAEETDSAAENALSLESRMEVMEYRLERTLMTLNHCQRDLADIHKRFQKLVDIQRDDQAQQVREQKSTKRSLYAILALIFVGQITPISTLGWQMLNALAGALHMEPTLAAGLLLSTTTLWVMAILMRNIARFLHKRREEDAVCDR